MRREQVFMSHSRCSQHRRRISSLGWIAVLREDGLERRGRADCYRSLPSSGTEGRGRLRSIFIHPAFRHKARLFIFEPPHELGLTLALGLGLARSCFARHLDRRALSRGDAKSRNA
jgi:hypothetical protein